MNFEHGIIIFALGLAFHAGVLHNRIATLRKDFEDECERNRKMRHDRMDEIVAHIDRLKLLTLRIIPRDQWPEDL